MKINSIVQLLDISPHNEGFSFRQVLLEIKKMINLVGSFSDISGQKLVCSSAPLQLKIARDLKLSRTLF